MMTPLESFLYHQLTIRSESVNIVVDNAAVFLLSVDHSTNQNAGTSPTLSILLKTQGNEQGLLCPNGESSDLEGCTEELTSADSAFEKIHGHDGPHEESQPSCFSPLPQKATPASNNGETCSCCQPSLNQAMVMASKQIQRMSSLPMHRQEETSERSTTMNDELWEQTIGHAIELTLQTMQSPRLKARKRALHGPSLR